MRYYDNNIMAWAGNVMTTDQVMESKEEVVCERLRPLEEEDVIKRTAKTDFVNLWTEENIQEDDQGNQIGECHRCLKGIGKMIFHQPGKFKLQFCGKDRHGNPMIDPNQIIDGDPDYLRHCLTNQNVWDNHCIGLDLCKHGTHCHKGSAVGSLINGLYGSSEENGDSLINAQKALASVMELLRDYNAQELPGYIREHGLQIDDRNGAIMIPGESINSPFNVTVYPEA